MPRTAAKPATSPTPNVVSPFRAGQVWRYRTRRGEAGSRFIVLHLENPEGKGNVVHVRVEGVRLAAGRGAPAHTAIAHVAIAEAALVRSALAVVSATQPPAFEAEYRAWSRQKGVFTVDLAEAIRLFERVLR